MAQKNTSRHDANAFDEFDPTALSRGQLDLVIALRWWLDEHRAKANRERELVAIHRNTVERDRQAAMQVNDQLLTQIKVLREA